MNNLFGSKEDVSPPKVEEEKTVVKEKASTPAWMQLLAFVVAFACFAWFFGGQGQQGPQRQQEQGVTAWVQPHWYQGPQTDLEDGFNVVPVQVQPGISTSQPQLDLKEAALKKTIQDQQTEMERLRIRLDALEKERDKVRDFRGWRD